MWAWQGGKVIAITNKNNYKTKQKYTSTLSQPLAAIPCHKNPLRCSHTNL